MFRLHCCSQWIQGRIADLFWHNISTRRHDMIRANLVPRGLIPLIPRGRDSSPVRKGLGERDLWEQVWIRAQIEEADACADSFLLGSSKRMITKTQRDSAKRF